MSAAPATLYRLLSTHGWAVRAVAVVALVALGGTAAFLFGIAAYVRANPGLTYNASASMPLGYYRRLPLDRLAYGDAVFACLPPKPLAIAIARHYIAAPGPCRGHEEVLKLVLGLPGDVVDVSDRRVLVNGRLLPNSARIARDGDGRAAVLLPAGRYRLRSDEYWLETPATRSWDSRYYGPFRGSLIRARAKIVWAT